MSSRCSWRHRSTGLPEPKRSAAAVLFDLREGLTAGPDGRHRPPVDEVQPGTVGTHAAGRLRLHSGAVPRTAMCRRPNRSRHAIRRTPRGWKAWPGSVTACGTEIARDEWDTAERLPQEGYWHACQAFNASPEQRTCPGCGQVHPRGRPERGALASRLQPNFADERVGRKQGCLKPCRA